MVIILSELRWISRASSARRKRGGRGMEAGWKRGGCRCTLRCAVSITHPSAVSTSPNRRFCRRTAHFSYSNLFRSLSPLSIRFSRIPMFMRPGHQQIFLRFLDHCFPYAPLLAPSFNHALFPLARMPTIAANNLFKAPEWNR